MSYKNIKKKEKKKKQCNFVRAVKESGWVGSKRSRCPLPRGSYLGRLEKYPAFCCLHFL